MHFGPWEVVAFGGLWIGAFMLAVDVGLRISPAIRARFPELERITLSGWWAFLPIILLTVSGAIFVLDRVFLSSKVAQVGNTAPVAEHSQVTTPRTVERPQPLPTVQRRLTIDVSLDDLRNLYKDKMTAEGDRLFLPYRGKWTKVSGKVDDVSESLLGSRRVVHLANDKQGTTTLLFEPSWHDRLAVLRKGQVIFAICQIQAASVYSVQLDYCELPDP